MVRVHQLAVRRLPGPKPSKAELLAAAGKRVPDHFARPGNRFWPALHAAGFTERLLRPSEERELLRVGQGITNLVERATLGSGELRRQELQAGGRAFERKVIKYRPRSVAILGVSAYRLAFALPFAEIGPQSQKIGEALVWVLPNPSGLNAHFTPNALAKVFRDFRLALRRGL